MPVVIDPLGLTRARRTDASPQVTINGSGFSSTPGQNQVFMSGTLAPIVAEGATQITFDFPAPFSTDLLDLRSIHVPIKVVNLDNGEVSDDAYVWIPGDLDEVADDVIDEPIPGPFEVLGAAERPRVFEARDMQRLATLLEALITDIEDGNVLAWDGSKLAEPAGLKGSGGGQVLEVDLAEPTDLRWHFRLDAWLPFGGQLSNATGTGNLIANGYQDFNIAGAVATEQWAADDGTIDRISLEGLGNGGGLIDRVRLLVNSVSQFDSGTGLATLEYQATVSVAVSKGDVIELELTESGGGGSDVAVVGGVRLLLD